MGASYFFSFGPSVCLPLELVFLALLVVGKQSAKRYYIITDCSTPDLSALLFAFGTQHRASQEKRASDPRSNHFPPIFDVLLHLICHCSRTFRGRTTQVMVQCILFTVVVWVPSRSVGSNEKGILPSSSLR